MFGLQRRLVRTWECDTDMPHEGRLLQTSHTAAMTRSFSSLEFAGLKPKHDLGDRTLPADSTDPQAQIKIQGRIFGLRQSHQPRP